MKFILASQSPQRKKLLESIGLDFKVIPADIDEEHGGYQDPGAIVKYIAEQKALEVAKAHPNEWIIAADTIVVLPDGRICLKPKDEAEARETLLAYKNAYCRVYSGLALYHAASGVMMSDFAMSQINFIDFENETVEAHLKTGRWKGSSGSIKIEDCDPWIESIEGDYSNIIGLPIFLLKKWLHSID